MDYTNRLRAGPALGDPSPLTPAKTPLFPQAGCFGSDFLQEDPGKPPNPPETILARIRGIYNRILNKDRSAMGPLSPNDIPKFRPDLPVYPHLLQLLRVTETTTTGPDNLLVYTANVQQLGTSNLLPRDREPCLVVDPNKLGLAPGYYLGRLSGNYSSLPVYEVCDLAIPGLTQTQFDSITSSLTPDQIDVLKNLTPCQLQILLTTLSISQIGTLTSSSTPQQLQNLAITTPTTGQSSTLTLVTSLTTHQLLQLSTAIPTEKLTEMVTTLSVSQIQKLIDSLTVSDLNRVVNVLTIPQIINLLTATTNSELTDLVTTLSTNELSTLTQVTSTQLDSLVTNLTSAQILTLTSSLTDNQFMELLDSLTITQIDDILTTLSGAELDTLFATVTDPNRISLLLQVVTVSDLQSLVQDLTADQLVTLVSYPPSVINQIFNHAAAADLELILDRNPPVPVLGNQAQPPALPLFIGQPSATPTSLDGYATTVVDKNDGSIYTYAGGQWNQVGGGGGGTSPTSTNGQSALGSNQNAGTSYAAVSGISLSLPSAGTYKVVAKVSGELTVTNAAGGELYIALYDTTGTATAITDSEAIITSAHVVSTPNRGTATIDIHITVAAAATISLYTKYVITGTISAAVIYGTGSGYGETIMNYVKLS